MNELKSVCICIAVHLILRFQQKSAHSKCLILHLLQSLKSNLQTLIPLPLLQKNLSSMSELQLSWNDIFMLGSEIDTTALKLKYNKISKIDDRPFFKSYSIYLQLFNGLF